MTQPLDREPRRARKRREPSGGVAMVALVVAILALVVAIAAVVLVVERVPQPTTVAQAAVSDSSTAGPAGSIASASPTPSPTPQPQTRAGARAAATRAFAFYSLGNYGKFWDQWTKQSQAVVSRSEYIRRFQECPAPAEGLRWSIDDVRVSGSAAKVTASRSILVDQFTFRYQAGRWRYEMTADQRRQYEGQTVDEIVDDQRAKGLCA
ncbi:hypothetical protein Aph01nite_11490 [Acrocarpospora phusangensis]|uniref:Uncharacterized protein n=1 Tax=Acrocarpospora phusangensis TaxID=1070424 RepID=A0A919Q7W6_9ACTN|nr:hypothetical protein [Acrocarpospora phusangensis]GIH22839.1 hypothetical protein Aph01nite_11490 [Acrocarpospora phusangensis]